MQVYLLPCKVKADLLLLHFALLGFTDTAFFTNYSLGATFHRASLLSRFGNLIIFQMFSLLYICYDDL